ncbi:MAG: type I secretion system permease/ATPase [Rickettsiaceae bacterium H1]|nr:type I secretion system permease/ATPase [Rickettsiaceae bacterium H1]
MISNNEQIEKELRNSLLYQSLNKCKKILWIVFWFSSAINILILFLPIYTSQVLDRVLSSGSISTLGMLSLITIMSFVCSAFLEISRSLIMTKIGDWLDSILSSDLIEKAIALTTIKNNTSSGEVLRDLNIIKNFISGNGMFFFFDAPWSILYLIVIFMIHPIIGNIAIAGIVILTSMALWNDFSTKKLLKAINEATIRNINEIEIATRNAEVVEAMGMIPNIVMQWSEKNDINRGTQAKASSRSVMIMAITKAIRSTIQISVIGVGAYLAVSGQKTAGGIIAASILMGRTLAPFEMAISNWKNLSSARMSYKRLQILLLTYPKRTQAMQLPDPVGKVMFDKVVFTPYGSNKPIIKGISFEAKPGSIIGVIGSSAAGKSTIAKLMVGVLKPIAGNVRLDGAGTYTWKRDHFGQFVGYLPQDIELFNATVKANIARMTKNPDPEKVVKAAKIAGVHEMILTLPDGYDTIIGFGGLALSGGQKQRIGLARAFYGDIKLLVLDEPNSNLDSAGEICLMNALKYAMENKITTFMMTHKISLLSAVEIIMIIKDGMIEGMGSRDEILAQIMPLRQQQKKELVTKENKSN